MPQVRTCDPCQRNNATKLRKQHAPLHPIPVKDDAWYQVGIDLVGRLHEFQRSLTITDYYTKWAEAFPLKDKTASSLADILFSVS